MNPIEQLSDVWLIVFAGITACSPIVVALLTKQWGRRVGRTSPSEEVKADLPHALELSLKEHDQTQQMIRDHTIEMRSHFDRLLRYVLPANTPPTMVEKLDRLDGIE